jgi:hypothetical protein
MDKKDFGYEHPHSILTYNPSNSVYQSYNDNGYQKQKSTIYSTYGKVYSENNKICPECEDNAISICNCSVRDMICKQGHVWYINSEGEIKLEDPHLG